MNKTISKLFFKTFLQETKKMFGDM